MLTALLEKVTAVGATLISVTVPKASALLFNSLVPIENKTGSAVVLGKAIAELPVGVFASPTASKQIANNAAIFCKVADVGSSQRILNFPFALSESSKTMPVSASSFTLV